MFITLQDLLASFEAKGVELYVSDVNVSVPMTECAVDVLGRQIAHYPTSNRLDVLISGSLVSKEKDKTPEWTEEDAWEHSMGPLEE